MTSSVKAGARKARAIERNKGLKPDRVFNVKLAELPNMVDAVFDGDYDVPGWVIMAANGKGRDLVNGLFPKAYIEWKKGRGLAPDQPDDWLGFKINLPDAVAATETKLPLELIPASRTVDDITPDQLAMLLAIGVKRAGGRAAILRQDQESCAVRCDIFGPPQN